METFVVSTKNNIRLFVFGSFLRKSNPNDMDLIWIYANHANPKEVMAFVHSQEAMLAKKFQLPIHSIVLSVKESQQTQFIAEVGARPLARIEDLLDFRKG